MGRKRNKKGAKDEGNAAEAAMEKAVQRVQVILREHSEEEIRATLLQCNLNHNVAIDRLLSLQDTSNEQGSSNQLPDSSTTTTTTTTTSSNLVPKQSAITNGVTRSMPISSSDAVPSLSVPSSSDITNGETRSVTISSNVAVPSLSVPSPRPLTEQNVTKAPVKADSPLLHQKPTNPIANSFTQSVAGRDPQHSAFHVNQPMYTRQNTATASSLGPRPQTSMSTHAFGTYPSSESEPHINQQAMNRGQVPSGQYCNVMNSPYWRPNQNESYYDMAPIQQRGGSSMMSTPYTWLEPDDPSTYESLNSVFAPYRNSTLSLSATSSVPSSHASAHDFGNAANSRLGYEDVSRYHLPSNFSGTSSIGSSSHASAYGFDMSGVNAANSRLRYEDVSRRHLPSNSSGTSSSGPSYYASAHGFDKSGGNAANSRMGYDDVSRISHLSSNSSGTSSIGPSYYASAYGFDKSSGNAANSRLEYEDVSRNHLPSNSGGGASIGPSWHVKGSNSRLGYGDYLLRVHLQEREAYFEKIRADLASSSLEQEYNRRDHTKQRPRDK